MVYSSYPSGGWVDAVFMIYLLLMLFGGIALMGFAFSRIGKRKRAAQMKSTLKKVGRCIAKVKRPSDIESSLPSIQIGVFVDHSKLYLIEESRKAVIARKLGGALGLVSLLAFILALPGTREGFDWLDTFFMVAAGVLAFTWAGMTAYLDKVPSDDALDRLTRAGLVHGIELDSIIRVDVPGKKRFFSNNLRLHTESEEWILGMTLERWSKLAYHLPDVPQRVISPPNEGP